METVISAISSHYNVAAASSSVSIQAWYLIFTFVYRFIITYYLCCEFIVDIQTYVFYLHSTFLISAHPSLVVFFIQTTQTLHQRLKLDRPDKNFTSTVSDSHHWGITVNVDDGNQTICYCCSLPLFSKYLVKEDNGGIMVFSCSHTYHTVCLKNKDCTATCLVCDRFLR